jgi:hypothetical protein
MNTIQQTIHIPESRRLHLDLSLPEDVPTGAAEMLVVVSPIAEKRNTYQAIKHLAGSCAASVNFAGDPVAMQRAMRDEW